MARFMGAKSDKIEKRTAGATGRSSAVTRDPGDRTGGSSVRVEPDIRLGGRFKHARLLLGMNLRQIADLAGVSESYVSKLENDHVRPSLATLHRLANALQTNISALVSEAEPFGKNVTVVKANRRTAFQFSDGRSGDGIRLEKLIPSQPDNLLQANVHVIAPGSGSEELISHTGQEFGYVLEGALELIVGDETYRLGAGDAFCFSSKHPHGYRNKSDQTVRVVWVNTPPTF